jgi:hypothetical protein
MTQYLKWNRGTYFNPLINGDLCPCGSGKKYGADFPEEFPANTVTNRITLRSFMIIEEMILGCYYAFIEGNRKFVPEGMNETSSRMTMSWLNCMLNTGACFNRSGFKT